jgi:light-harvesting complex I chlorophyll a/b binding protein 2
MRRVWMWSLHVLVELHGVDVGDGWVIAAAEPSRLAWMVQAELVHCRWAMLGAAGIFIPELLTKIGILNTPSWYTAGSATYFADQGTLFIVELLLFAWAENRRWADIARPGSVNTDPIFPNYKLTGTDVGYPGGLWFDPLGYGSGSPEKLKELRTKEIKNGRLAMMAVLGAFVQANVTHVGPIDNLFAHIADPYHTTILQSVSILVVPVVLYGMEFNLLAFGMSRGSFCSPSIVGS